MIDVIAQSNFPLNRVDFHVIQRPAGDPGGVMAVAAPLTLKAYDQENPRPLEGPTFSLQRRQAQLLIDRLWELGLRPSEAAGSLGALAQAEDHIKSLKRINDSLLSVVAPK